MQETPRFGVSRSVLGLEVMSQMLPVNAHQSLVCFLGMANLLCDAMLAPELLDLSVALTAEVQGVPPSDGMNKKNKKNTKLK